MSTTDNIFEKSGTYIILIRFTSSRKEMEIIPWTAHHAEGRNNRVLLAGYRSRPFVSAALRLAGTRLHSTPLTDSFLLFRCCPGDRMTPLACREAPAPAAAPAPPLIPLRGMFVAIDHTMNNAQRLIRATHAGLGLTADTEQSS